MVLIMTSELLIANKNAIVMGADSTVTVNNIKIYNGFNKLFRLSNELQWELWFLVLQILREFP